ncbi:hypothetical protein V5O48_004636 [Marasmius crinis-equi]|uniref:XPG-I domain-containing protein n=1 Tax=Marasmius crinis-equi TaxID=585013 RepID=A0ABR3FPM9_9AGAR
MPGLFGFWNILEPTKLTQPLVKYAKSLAVDSNGMVGRNVLVELAYLEQVGKFQAIVTNNSCIFAFGAQIVLMVNQCQSTRVVVDVYDTRVIEQQLCLSYGGFLLYAFLVGIDWDYDIDMDTFNLDAHSTPGYAPVDGFRVAQTGVRDTFFEEYRRISESGSSNGMNTFLQEFRHKVMFELKYMLRIPCVVKRLEGEAFPSVYSRTVLEWASKGEGVASDHIEMP